MASKPLILVSPSIESRGVEFSDLSSSLSLRYEKAILAAGGIPVIAPATVDAAILAESVRRTDGVLLTGGDDINPQLYSHLYEEKLSASILKTVEQTPDEGARDLRESIMIQEIFRQRKPLLAICRGHQMLQVVFGGRLVVDIQQQVTTKVNHRQSDRPLEIVHEVTLTPGSLLSKICKTQTLGVNSTHHQAILEPVEPFVATARSQDGLVEAMELPDSILPFFLSVQFHPERLVQKHARYRSLFRTFVSACAKSLK